MIERGQVEHDSHNIYYRSTPGAIEAERTLRLGLAVRSREEIRQVLVRIWREGQGEKLHQLLTTSKETDNERYYAVDVKMPEKGCLLWYYFIITGSGGTCYYGNNPDQLGGRGDVYYHVPPSYQITVFNKGAKTPDWFKHTVMYQIFPDRFYRKGNELIEKKGAVYHASWQDPPSYFKDPDTKEIVAYDFFGGNLKGIEAKLPYLKELGISVIYLNPVFESESNHHYDTGDYHKIDPILGTNEEFRHLIDTAREMGIRIIIDGVFSHTGSNSRYFNRQGMYDSVGAYQSVDSPYYEWYSFRNYPNDYDSWWGFSTLPNVRETTPSYMNFIIHNGDSVLHHWLKEGIGGWRLDVIDELPPQFSQAFYRELKDTDPDAVMIGEVWEDASHKIAYGVQREYLCGQEMDSAMNYPFRGNVIDFLLGHIDAGTCQARLESLRENYPPENFYAMMNLMGSHDIMRAITVFGEAMYYDGMPAVEQARYRLDEEHYELGKKRLMMAALWQMTYPGVPCVYYGDEIGMQGFKDPYNRRPYEWDGGDQELKKWYEQCIAERNHNTALRTGEILPLAADGDVIAFARVIRRDKDVFGQEAEPGAFVTVFNRNRYESRHFSADVSDFADGEFEILFQNEPKRIGVQRGRLNVELPPLTGYLLRHVKPKKTFERLAGVLLHPSSLPSKYGGGSLGKEARKFIDWLAEAGQSVWQILPLNPVGFGNSPYQSPSAFAGNPLLIDVDDLIERGLLTKEEAKLNYVANSDTVDFERLTAFKSKCFRKAFARFAKREKDASYEKFCQTEAYWLDEYALFRSIKRECKEKSWIEWPERLKKRDPKAMKESRARLADDIAYEKFLQFIFDRQWSELRDYAHTKNIRILGDMPFFVAQDSADVWSNQKLFMLNKDGSPDKVAGVPPDYFSATGQLWGNPQYDWETMESEKYAWWINRFRKLYEMIDIVRIDHFRAFESYWEVDGKAETAIDGKWKKGPGFPFFQAVRDVLGEDVPIVAEDLGIITDEVEELRAKCDFPGMKVLHFTLHFNEQGRLGFVAPENSIVYTGTHDNNTTVGWYKEEVDDKLRVYLSHMLNVDKMDVHAVCEKLVEFAYATDARMAIIPMQDLLGLDSGARMNKPGVGGNAWKWCLRSNYLEHLDAGRLREMAEKYRRI